MFDKRQSFDLDQSLDLDTNEISQSPRRQIVQIDGFVVHVQLSRNHALSRLRYHKRHFQVKGKIVHLHVRVAVPLLCMTQQYSLVNIDISSPSHIWNSWSLHYLKPAAVLCYASAASRLVFSDDRLTY